jgi:hypothetical protein
MSHRVCPKNQYPSVPKRKERKKSKAMTDSLCVGISKSQPAPRNNVSIVQSLTGCCDLPVRLDVSVIGPDTSDTSIGTGGLRF